MQDQLFSYEVSMLANINALKLIQCLFFFYGLVRSTVPPFKLLALNFSGGLDYNRLFTFLYSVCTKFKLIYEDLVMFFILAINKGIAIGY